MSRLGKLMRINTDQQAESGTAGFQVSHSFFYHLHDFVALLIRVIMLFFGCHYFSVLCCKYLFLIKTQTLDDNVAAVA